MFNLSYDQRETIRAAIASLAGLLGEDRPDAPPAPENVPIIRPAIDGRRVLVSIDVEGNDADYGRIVVVVE